MSLPHELGLLREWEQRLVTAMRWLWRGGVVVAALAISLAVSGCAGFFVCDKASCTSSGSGSGSGSGSTTDDFAFVGFTAVSGSTATSTINSYSIGSGALTSAGSITVTGYVPMEMAVAPSNSILYVASVPNTTTPTASGIYGYTIGSSGALTQIGSGPLLSGVFLGAMAISPDGGFLYTLDETGEVVTQYQVNTSSGALTTDGQAAATGLGCILSVTAPPVRTCDIQVSPEGTYIGIALGAEGDLVYPYSSSSGINSQVPLQIPTGTTALNNFAVTWDKANFLYTVQTTELTNYQVTSSSAANEVAYVNFSGTSIAPRAVALNASYGAVYTANPAAGSISGYSISSTGTFTALTGQPFAGPANVAALGFERSGGYAVAVGYDTSAGIQLMSVSSAGALAEVASAGTTAVSPTGTTTYPVLLALVH